MGECIHWPAELVHRALELSSAGLSATGVSAVTGIPTATIRTYLRRPPRRVVGFEPGACARCGVVHDFGSLPSDLYAYLLGAYLGDGWLGASQQLRIACDVGYPEIIDEMAVAIEAIRGRAPRRYRPKSEINCIHLVAGWKQWACHFPQHGPGRKHERPIVLVDWQREHVRAAPEAFLRGLIHSDGCRTVNRFKTKLPSGRVGEYEYPRYFFSNMSADIRWLFCETCDQLGIRWTQSKHRNISVSHRHSVARLDEFIGPKA